MKDRYENVPETSDFERALIALLGKHGIAHAVIAYRESTSRDSYVRAYGGFCAADDAAASLICDLFRKCLNDNRDAINAAALAAG